MARRTKRSDGRYAVILRLEQPDGSRARKYFNGRSGQECDEQESFARGSPAAARPHTADSHPRGCTCCPVVGIIPAAIDAATGSETTEPTAVSS